MKTVLITAVLGMVALLSACPPIATVEPIYQWGDEKQKVDDPGLVGEWISYEGFFYLNLQRNDKETNQYFTEFTLKAEGQGKSSEYRAVLVRLGNCQFLDVTPASDDIYRHEFLPHAVVTHTIYRIRRNGDELQVAPMDDDWAKQHVPPDKVIQATSEDVTLTSSTQELQKFLAEHGDDPEAFNLEYHFKRQGTVADAESLSAIAFFNLSKTYMDAGQYEKALPAAQRYLELRPKNPAGHYQIAETLLANYQAEQARTEFRQWSTLCNRRNPDKDWELDDDSCTDEDWLHEDLGRTYFAEGKYADADKEFSAYLNSVDDKSLVGSMDSVFWEMLTLRTLRRPEAVRKLVARYEGQPGVLFWEEAIGKYLQGELAEADLLKKAGDGTLQEKKQKRQALFYTGSVYLSSGDNAKARELFQQVAATGDYKSDEVITARFRLRQLAVK